MGVDFLDDIYVLDLENEDAGWDKVEHVKCPIPSQYLATLTRNNYVHLLTQVNKWPDWQSGIKAHFSIPISTLLGSKFCNE